VRSRGLTTDDTLAKAREEAAAIIAAAKAEGFELGGFRIRPADKPAVPGREPVN
jgi:hypothetical protein